MKKLQRLVKRNQGAIIDRVDKVENLMDAMRAEVERQAAARVALQHRANEAHRDELMRAMAVWGLPREARFPDQMGWWETAAEATARPRLVED